MTIDVAIVGAGAAGIAAARRLEGRGYRATLFEARARVGGRAWTDVSTFGVPVDMGCAWLHSADTNPWTVYARAQGFPIIEQLPQWGGWIGRDRLPEEVRREWGAAFARNESLLAQAAARGIDVAISQLLPDDRYRPRFDAVVNFLMGQSSGHVSSLDFARYSDSQIDWAVRSGLGAVVAHAARQLDVRVSTPVRQIDATAGQVRVRTDVGVAEAGAVIVTVSTSVLAQEQVRFTPALPTAFVRALEDVPLGTTAKVFLRMSAGLLPHDGTVHFVRTQSSAEIGSYATRPSGQEVLLAYFGGPLARELESRGELEAFARDELGQMFGAAFVRGIEQTLITNWTRDVWSQGCYSYAKPGRARSRERLSEPVHERVFFAGEACSIDQFGTIQGAWDTGVAAAERAMAVLGGPQA